MQLRRGSGARSIQAGLAAATAGLLASPVAATPPTDVESSVLFYSEPDRVTAVEAVVESISEIAEDQSLRFKFVFDSLTGASANGATPSSAIQSFTRPSGQGSYTVQPGETPLDDTFHDTRAAGSVGYSRPIGRLSRLNLGANGSVEYDYFSLGASAGLTRDFNQRNTTLSAGLAFSRDNVSPEGDIPLAFASMVPAGQPLPRVVRSDSKLVYDAVLGLTQVLGRSTLGRVNYSVSYAAGYLTDPYKLLSLVAGPGEANAGEPVDHLFESRPDSRIKHSVYGQLRHQFSEDSADLSYRFLWDDWGVQSHTWELRYRKRFSPRNYVQPHVRYYNQAEADFYRRFLVNGTPLPDHATADYRLGNLDALTLGATLGRVLPDGQIFKITFEYYQQYSGRGPPDSFGALDGLELQPDVSAIMARIGYGRSF